MVYPLHFAFCARPSRTGLPCGDKLSFPGTNHFLRLIICSSAHVSARDCMQISQHCACILLYRLETFVCEPMQLGHENLHLLIDYIFPSLVRTNFSSNTSPKSRPASTTAQASSLGCLPLIRVPPHGSGERSLCPGTSNPNPMRCYLSISFKSLFLLHSS
jgi:hypothetical protein